jgi:hypothetical protein
MEPDDLPDFAQAAGLPASADITEDDAILSAVLLKALGRVPNTGPFFGFRFYVILTLPIHLLIALCFLPASSYAFFPILIQKENERFHAASEILKLETPYLLPKVGTRREITAANTKP